MQDGVRKEYAEFRIPVCVDHMKFCQIRRSANFLKERRNSTPHWEQK